MQTHIRNVPFPNPHPPDPEPDPPPDWNISMVKGLVLQ